MSHIFWTVNDPHDDGMAARRCTGLLDFTSTQEARDRFAVVIADGRHPRIVTPDEHSRLQLSLISLDSVLTISPTVEEPFHAVS
jgi:hypothetical protein